MKRVRVGVAGTGGVFQGGHLPGYPDVEEAQLVALSDVAEETLKRAERGAQTVYTGKAQEAEKAGNLDLAERLKEDVGSIKTYTSVAEMLAKEELDLVDVCTPTRYHDPIAIEALNSGVNVMVEKPMARTYLECLRVIEAVENSRKLYQHNENWLYDPFWYAAKKFIEGGAIGEVQLIFIAAAHGGPEGREWFWNPDMAGGGSLLDNGVHAITASWFLSGFEKKPAWVKAAEPYGIGIRMKTRVLGGRFRPVAVEDDAHVLIRYEDERTGAWSTAHVEGSWSHQDSPDTAIIGTNGRIEPFTEEGKTFLKITDPKGAVRKIELVKPTWVLGIAGEIRNMCNCVLENVKPLCDERIGAETTAIVDAAYLSQKGGKRAVTLDEFKDYALKIQEREGERAPDILLRELLKGIQG